MLRLISVLLLAGLAAGAANAQTAPKAGWKNHDRPVPTTRRDFEVMARRAQEVLGKTPDAKTPLHRFTQGKRAPRPGCVFVRAEPDPNIVGLKHAVWDCRGAKKFQQKH